MRGKYSPTVNAAYAANQNWWDNHCKGSSSIIYDVDGYDQYGYDSNEVDRAGNQEYVYYTDDECGENWQYNQALNDWGFDGIKPVRR